MIYTRRMHQAATYWPPAGIDAAGKVTFGAPVAIACRWENRNEIFIGPQGREETSTAVVYVGSDVTLQGYLYLGDSVATNPKTVAGAREIRGRGVSPSLGNSQYLVKVFL